MFLIMRILFKSFESITQVSNSVVLFDHKVSHTMINKHEKNMMYRDMYAQHMTHW